MQFSKRVCANPTIRVTAIDEKRQKCGPENIDICTGITKMEMTRVGFKVTQQDCPESIFPESDDENTAEKDLDLYMFYEDPVNIVK